ncbi:hypothetical protein GCM10017559_59470 [Streptosporangium longisporum]|uniref:Uncharacterized protein n=1 Tax=Streptosporangium longisporum TaxID=46187 RepID=A0ABN3YF99_9ACTN
MSGVKSFDGDQVREGVGQVRSGDQHSQRGGGPRTEPAREYDRRAPARPQPPDSADDEDDGGQQQCAAAHQRRTALHGLPEFSAAAEQRGPRAEHGGVGAGHVGQRDEPRAAQ